MYMLKSSIQEVLHDIEQKNGTQ